MTPDEKNLEALEAVYHDAALADAETGESSPEERAWAKGLHARVDGQLAELERNLTPVAASPKAIRPSLLAMARDALLARIDEVVAAGRLQVAHRNLSTLSDDDLRRLLQSLEPDQE